MRSVRLWKQIIHKMLLLSTYFWVCLQFLVLVCKGFPHIDKVLDPTEVASQEEFEVHCCFAFLHPLLESCKHEGQNWTFTFSFSTGKDKFAEHIGEDADLLFIHLKCSRKHVLLCPDKFFHCMWLELRTVVMNHYIITNTPQTVRNVSSAETNWIPVSVSSFKLFECDFNNWGNQVLLIWHHNCGCRNVGCADENRVYPRRTMKQVHPGHQREIYITAKMQLKGVVPMLRTWWNERSGGSLCRIQIWAVEDSYRPRNQGKKVRSDCCVFSMFCLGAIVTLITQVTLRGFMSWC